MNVIRPSRSSIPAALQIHPPLVADEEDVFRDNLSNVLLVDEGGGEGNTPIWAGLPRRAPCVGAVDGLRLPGLRDVADPTDLKGIVGL
jgi:hypothetical protein